MSSKLDELSKNFNELSSINEKQEKRVRYLERKAIKLVISYIFLQTIIFFSITQPSTISCNNWWFPFCLSLLIAIIFGLTSTSTISKWARMQYQYELNLLELEMIHYRMFLVKNSQIKIDESGSTTSDQFNSCYQQQQQQQQEVLRPDMVKVYQRYGYIIVMACCLLAFTGLILRACHSFLCPADASKGE